mmetsp:Transcript_19949/g.67553  ORF Transcript_19949/g.67553 Transcript_19949/m.67553 type:complete len:203 (+) Transcript_19949:1357-1965(+)
MVHEAHLLEAELIAPLGREQLLEDEDARGGLEGLEGHDKVRQRRLRGNGRVGQHERGDCVARAAGAARARLAQYDLEEVRRDVEQRRRLAERGVVRAQRRRVGRQEERARDDDDFVARVRQLPAELLEARPVVSVEADTDLGRDVDEAKRVVHRLRARLVVRRRRQVAPVVARPRVVAQPRTEALWHHAGLVEGLALALGLV